MRYILHYTKPGDIVFDGFCGTGMTGVAAQMCGCPDEEFKQKIESEMPGIEWGARKAILNDLSPAATFIAYNYNTPIDVDEFQKEAERILTECEKECGWMYETNHVDKSGNLIMDLHGNPVKGRINYTVWSDVFICPTCSKDFIFWDVAVDANEGKVDDVFSCPYCASKISKRDCTRARETHFDNKLNSNVTLAKQVPVIINYAIGTKRYEKRADNMDISLIEKINQMQNNNWYPINKWPKGEKTQEPIRLGMNNVHQIYTKRNLFAISNFVHLMRSNRYLSLITAVTSDISKMARVKIGYYYKGGGGPFIPGLSGTLYIPSLSVEKRVFFALENRLQTFVKTLLSGNTSNVLISTNSLSKIDNLPKNSIDYIFTDPPFGGNINYSELNFLWESWLKIISNNSNEAIISNIQNKKLLEYQAIMTKCFNEYFRVLKSGRWMTVEFHNSHNSVWNAIQESIQRAGFIIADVRTLNKNQGSFNQVTSSIAVKQDLVISAYKPKDSFKKEFVAKAGSPETAWTFISQHLEQLPVAVIKDKKIELIAERQAYLLFDRMVAYHIMNGISVPLDASDFYKGLDEKFLYRDTMYFLPDQVNEYDTARIKNEVEKPELELFVTNERTAIAGYAVNWKPLKPIRKFSLNLCAK
jgi:DNA-directed RNA polymerase subunit RPC12/RpoP